MIGMTAFFGSGIYLFITALLGEIRAEAQNPHQIMYHGRADQFD